MRSEEEIFDELTGLCTSPGYIHALALLSFQSSLVMVDKELTARTLAKLHSSSRLITTELATLIGLMMRGPIAFDRPKTSVVMEYVDRSHALLKELHQAIMEPGTKVIQAEAAADRPENPFISGKVLREVIFYGGQSAYAFQYRDMAAKKYAADGEWLSANKDVDVNVCHTVCRSVVKVLQARVARTAYENARTSRGTMLPGFTFSCSDVAAEANLSATDVSAVIEAFTLPAEERNSAFTSLHRFNVAYAYPLIRKSADEFVLLQHYSMAEAFYNTPFYWMLADESYAPVALGNRGDFTEEFAFQRLCSVFGRRHVFRNVEIRKSKREILGEIDVLVVYGSQAIVLQAKSKMLTLEARSGNETMLRKDFKAAVQDAANQAVDCSTALRRKDVKLHCRDGRRVSSVAGVRDVLPICTVSDHYPALAFQASQFLADRGAGAVARVLTIDLFALDTMTEMLGSPLRLISYLHLRSRFGDKLLFGHENTLLGYHLKRNLWLENETDLLILEDNYGVEVDVCMSVRRDGMAGESTPEGILTRLVGTRVATIIAELEERPNPAAIQLGLLLLELSENAVEDISAAIDGTVAKTVADGNLHDATVLLSDADAGVTVHCARRFDSKAKTVLQRHCERRKQIHEAGQWFGIALGPNGCLQLACALIDD